MKQEQTLEDDITIDVIPHNGHVICSTIKENQYISVVYIGHSVEEAKQLFLGYVN